jgi:hypothetical protein
VTDSENTLAYNDTKLITAVKSFIVKVLAFSSLSKDVNLFICHLKRWNVDAQINANVNYASAELYVCIFYIYICIYSESLPWGFIVLGYQCLLSAPTKVHLIEGKTLLNFLDYSKFFHYIGFYMISLC